MSRWLLLATTPGMSPRHIQFKCCDSLSQSCPASSIPGFRKWHHGLPKRSKRKLGAIIIPISCQMQLTSNLQNLRKYLRSSPPLYPTATHGVQISPSPGDSAVASHIATPHPFSFLPIYHDYCLIDLLKCHSPVQTVTGFSPPKNNVCNS